MFAPFLGQINHRIQNTDQIWLLNYYRRKAFGPCFCPPVKINYLRAVRCHRDNDKRCLPRECQDFHVQYALTHFALGGKQVLPRAYI